MFKLNNSSSDSVNSDLAYGNGYIRRPKLRRVRSKDGKIIDQQSTRYSERERTRYGENSRYGGSEKRGYGSGSERRGYTSGSDRRGNTEAEILAVGAGLAALAREQNKHDLKNRNGKSPQVVAVRQSAPYEAFSSGSRGLGPSKVSHGSDSFDEDGWESASDAESENSVDSRLAFGVQSGGWWGKEIHRPLSRKSTVVDPRQFGRQNSLHGFVDEPVGFGTVTWTSTEDFGQQYRAQSVSVGPNESVNGSQVSLQQVFPVQDPTDPTRFEAARNSAASGSEPYIATRPAPAPLQHPQPYTPVSQSIYEPSYSTVSETSGILKNRTTSSGKSNSLAEAALVGVAGAAIGAAITSRHDDRKEKRREDKRDEYSRDDTSRISSRPREEGRDDSSRVGHKRRDSDKRDSKDERRRDKRDDPDRDDRKDKRRDKDRGKDGSRYSDEERRERKRDKRREDAGEASRDERREKRRDKEDRRTERSEFATRPAIEYDDRRTVSEAAITAESKIDPFMFQVADNAFPTPTTERSDPHQRHDSVPKVVTVEREPSFSRDGSSTKDRSFDTGRYSQDYSQYDDQGRRNRENDHGLRNAEAAYDETEHSTAPIAAGAVGVAAAIVAGEVYRESRSDKRRNERRSGQPSDYDDHDYESRGRDQAVKERDPVQEEADRAYREIVMARKIASQVIRSRSNSPDGSVVGRYSRKAEPEEVEIVTPPEMDHPKQKGPYDAPNADFNPDHHFDDPRELRAFRPATPVIYEGYRDPEARDPRPLLNLVRPTPVPSPLPEKEISRSESSRSEPTQPETARSEPARSSKSRDWDEKRKSVSEVGSNGIDSPTTSNISKGVTWGENETKHFSTESPSDHQEEYVSNSDVPAYENSRQPKSRSESKTSSKPSKGWGAIAAALTGAGAGAAVASSSNKSSSKKSRSTEEDGEKSPPQAYEYRGVVVEPGSPLHERRRQSPPSPGPKPASPSSYMPGSFGDDLEFTANVAAGLKDAGFNSDIVIEDPNFRRRSSPPGSNEKIYQAPYSETVSELGHFPPQCLRRFGSWICYG